MVQGRQFANNTSSASATATYERHEITKPVMGLQSKYILDTKVATSGQQQSKSMPTMPASGVWGRFQNAGDFKKMHNF